jgi:phosphorylcholine metabolism protein LicD
MGGSPQPKQKLNKTLHFLADLLDKHNIRDWFIGYGTLLGIVRNNSCIDNDDDVDIVCNKIVKKEIKNIMLENNFKIVLNTANILRMEHLDYSPIEFYCCKVMDSNYHDLHEKMVWTNCHPLHVIKWKKVHLHLPHDSIQKLMGRYGSDWEIPKKSKGFKSTAI